MVNSRITLLHSSRGRRVDGVRDYSNALVTALNRFGVAAELVDRRERSWLHELPDGMVVSIADRALPAALTTHDWVILQYSAFAFGRWGFAPWLPRLLRRLRANTRIAVMVHEPYVAWGAGRQNVISIGQRLQFRAVLRSSQLTLTSTEAWNDPVSRWSPSEPMHFPVGSNLPDMRASRPAARMRLGVSNDEIVFASMSTGHDSGLPNHVASALRSAVRDRGQVTYLNLGATAPAAPAIDGLTDVRPGWLTPDSLAERISSADVFLAPFVDGASTRRTSIMAALQHGVPVISTDGSNTDRVFRNADSGVTLAPADDPSSFGRLAANVAASADARARLAIAARTTYATQFSWDVLALRLMTALDVFHNVSTPASTAR